MPAFADHPAAKEVMSAEAFVPGPGTAAQTSPFHEGPGHVWPKKYGEVSLWIPMLFAYGAAALVWLSHDSTRRFNVAFAVEK